MYANEHSVFSMYIESIPLRYYIHSFCNKIQTLLILYNNIYVYDKSNTQKTFKQLIPEIYSKQPLFHLIQRFQVGMPHTVSSMKIFIYEVLS